MTRVPSTARTLAIAAIVLGAVPSFGADSPPAPRRFALIVAIRDYPQSQSLSSLDGTNRDAERLRRVLERGGFPEQNIDVVYDDAPDPANYPTRANILRRLDHVLNRAGAGDTVLVVTTSHGIVFDNESYLCPADAGDASMSGADAARRGLIAVNDIVQRMSQCKAAEKLLVVDACRDAAQSRTSGFVRHVRKPPAGVWLMCSCSEEQYSYVSANLRDGEPHAVFTYFLCEGLEGEADLVGNNNGEVSLFELYSYAYSKTQDQAWRLEGGRQNPELFGGVAPPFVVARLAGYRPPRISSDDADLQRRLMAEAEADRGNQIIQAANTAFRAGFQRQVERRNTDGEAALYRDHHHQICYAFGYLTSALDLDPECRLARLARGSAFRTCEMYAEAIEEFQRAGEHLDLYVKGRYESIADYYSRERNGQLNLSVPEPADKAATRCVPLHGAPVESSLQVGTVTAHAKIRVTEIRTDPAAETWLRVTAVNDNPLAESAWIQRRHVHWFEEAADIYTPQSPMFDRDSVGMPPLLARLDMASQNLYALAERLDGPADRIGEVRSAIDHSGPAMAMDRIGGIAGAFGFSIPNYARMAGGYVGVAEGYARLPADAVRRGASYASLPGAYAGAATGWAGYAADYHAGMRRAETAEDRRREMIKIKALEPVHERSVVVDASPWKKP